MFPRYHYLALSATHHDNKINKINKINKEKITIVQRRQDIQYLNSSI